ncbi:MAG: hypothetical protein CL609_03155 [Anaerolineaceae bacterium]|nr:hypothetical protein [Anaerolineaceae bacterium]
MPQRVLIILNPIANHDRSVQVAESLKTKLAQTSPLSDAPQIDWVVSQRAKETIWLAQESGTHGYNLVIAAGGDGTVHEVINGLMQIPPEKRPLLGILPLGSGNDFAHILGLPIDPWSAIQTCLNGQPKALDIGLVSDESNRREYFNNTLGIGFDAVVTIHTKRIKRIHGFMMYLIATLKTIFMDFPQMDLTVESDEKSWQQPTIMLTIGNGPREGGGFLVTPEAKVDDGIFHYAAIGKVSRFMMLRLVPEVMKGTHGRFQQIQMGTCRKMTIHSKQPLYAHCDGEVFSGFGDTFYQFTIEIQPGAIRVMK